MGARTGNPAALTMPARETKPHARPRKIDTPTERANLMKLIRFVTTFATLFIATGALAQEKKFVGYVIKANSSTVKGVMLVNGYSPTEIVGFISEDCASGQIGALQYVGKPKKKRGNVFQDFQTTCVGGPSPRIGQTTSVAVEVERMPDGRNMTEYTFSQGGKVGYSRYIR